MANRNRKNRSPRRRRRRGAASKNKALRPVHQNGTPGFTRSSIRQGRK